MNINLAENTLGQRIKAQRIKMHMTQDELAEVMCIPKKTISGYENDRVDIRSSVIVELAEHLHTTPNYLLGYEEDPALGHLETAMTVSNLLRTEQNKIFVMGFPFCGNNILLTLVRLTDILL